MVDFILPSTISNKQSDLFAKNLLWVANIINLLEFICFFNNLNISSDVFAGLQYQVSDYVEIPEYSYENSGWINGSGIMRVTPSMSEGIKMPWTYRIVFTDNDNEYVGVATSGTVRDENGSSIGSSKINNQAVNFYIQNTSFVNESGGYDLMDIVIHDVNDNDVFKFNRNHKISLRILIETSSDHTLSWAGPRFNRFP